MRARDFCSDREYPLTLALTYSCDPVFLDRVVVPALASGGADHTLIFADGSEVESAIARLQAPLRHLGRHYMLAPVRHTGAFHPKLILRLGREHAIAWLGSGNLTHGGWGHNRELVAAWRLGPNLEDTGAWVRPLLEQARMWTNDSLALGVLDRAREHSWLPDRPEADARLLLSIPSSLATQLEQRWAGRRFETVRFVTGSTDTDGAMLRWLARTFGVTRAVGAVTPNRCSFNAGALGRLPLKTSLIAVEPPYAHAKAYHLTGRDGDVLLIGSPNCSSAAWLLDPTRGGNVESLLIYERPDPDTLAALDPLFRPAARRPADVLEGVLPEEWTRPARPAVVMTSLRLDEDSVLIATVDPPLAAGWTVHLAISGVEIMLEQVAGASWHAPAPERIPFEQTVIAEYEIRRPSGAVAVRGRRWVDDVRLLQQTSYSRRIPGTIRRLGADGTDREDAARLAAVIQILHDLVEDASSAPDPERGVPRPQRPDNERGEVDPEKLIAALRDGASPEFHLLHGNASALSMGGFFALFFGSESTRSPREQPIDEPTGDEPEPVRAVTLVSERNRLRFERYMRDFMERLGSDRFRNECRARQLVEAVAFPFVVASRFTERGWTSEEQAHAWVRDAVRLLLYGPDRHTPSLLQATHERYAAQEKEDTFRRVLGNGLLWVTMVAGLYSTRWPADAEPLERAALLRDIWVSDLLLAEASDADINALVARYHAGEARELFGAEVAPLAQAIADVEHCIYGLGVDLHLEMQEHDPTPIRAGDLFWRPDNGWAVALKHEQNGSVLVYWTRHAREARIRPRGFWISVERAGDLDLSIRAAAERLKGLLRR